MKYIYVYFCIFFLGGIGGSFAEEKGWPWSSKNLKKIAAEAATIVVGKSLGKGGADKLFYIPISLSKRLPSEYGYAYEDVSILSLDGTELHAWVIPSKEEKAKGVVVFSHGNTGSVHSHFGFIAWLAKAGYHVVMTDYRGYGSSKGSPERKGMIEDIVAALHYARDKKEWEELPIISFGHSLGAAKSVVALDLLGNEERIKAAIFWAGFSSYKKIAKHMVGQTAVDIVSDVFSPVDHVAKVKDIPLLFLHGKRDGVIPFQHSQEMFKKAKGEKKIILSETGGHNNTLWLDEKKMQKQILTWLDSL